MSDVKVLALMATLKPFAALRPRPDLAARICELPYDVMSSAEARAIAAGNPLSFLHVSKPEIDLPPATDLYAPEVYAKAKENFQRLVEQGALRQDPEPHFYLYRQLLHQHSQVGLVAAASCQEYLLGRIKKHELTRPDKEDDRVKHIAALNSQTGPVFLVYRASPAIDEIVARRTAAAPEIDFTASDGVRHSAWVVADRADSERLAAKFERVPALYIADGHHRCAAAARVYQERQAGGGLAARAPLDTGARGLAGESAGRGRGRAIEAGDPSSGEIATPPPADGEESAFFLSVIFPHNQVRILPYHRVVKDLNGLSPRQLLRELDRVFRLRPGGAATPTRRHQVSLFLEGEWHALNFRPPFAGATGPIERLDATLLQKHVLDPIFGITDPRTSQRLGFIGGIRGTGELERLVRSGEYACAFSLFPTSVEDLMSIADAGGIMPPKSTWFEPKLRDALFCHLL